MTNINSIGITFCFTLLQFSTAHVLFVIAVIVKEHGIDAVIYVGCYLIVKLVVVLLIPSHVLE